MWPSAIQPSAGPHTFRVLRDGAQIGQFSEEEFQNKYVLYGDIRPSDHYRTEGMDDWRLVSEYLPEIKPVSYVNKGWACAFFAVFLPPLLRGLLQPILFFVVSLPLLLAAFVLAVISLSRGWMRESIWLIFGLILASIIAYMVFRGY